MFKLLEPVQKNREMFRCMGTAKNQQRRPENYMSIGIIWSYGDVVNSGTLSLSFYIKGAFSVMVTKDEKSLLGRTFIDARMEGATITLFDLCRQLDILEFAGLLDGTNTAPQWSMSALFACTGYETTEAAKKGCNRVLSQIRPAAHDRKISGKSRHGGHVVSITWLEPQGDRNDE